MKRTVRTERAVLTGFTGLQNLQDFRLEPMASFCTRWLLEGLKAAKACHDDCKILHPLGILFTLSKKGDDWLKSVASFYGRVSLGAD